VPATPEEVWGLVSDPARLPLWWPGVTRVPAASSASAISVVALARMRSNGDSSTSWRHTTRRSGSASTRL